MIRLQLSKNLKETDIEKIIIIGAGGHGKVCANIAKLIGYKEVYFLDDNKINSNQVIGKVNDYKKYMDGHFDFFVAIGNSKDRKYLFEELENEGIRIPNLIHPSAVIDESIELSNGSVFMANSVINADTRIGKGCIFNTSSSVDHDCIIGDFVHICPGSHVAGSVTIGSNSWIGIGSSISNNVVIASNVILGAGAAAVKDLKKSGTYVGVPCRLIL